MVMYVAPQQKRLYRCIQINAIMIEMQNGSYGGESVYEHVAGEPFSTLVPVHSKWSQ